MTLPLVVVPDDIPAEIAGSPALARLKQHARAEVYGDRPADNDELIRRIKDADAIINVRSWCKLTDEVMAQCPNLKMISVLGTGVDNVDLAAAAARGITVTNIPGIAAIQVAEHTLALMFATARQIPQKDRGTRAGHWPRSTILQLHGKTAGILGTGHIGRHVARLCKGVNMNVIAWTRTPDPTLAEEIGFTYVDFDEIFKQSDVVSVNLRLTPETKGLIGARELGLMKRSAIVVNTARGAICDEAALAKAVEDGTIAGAGVDVFSTEPVPPENPLTKVEKVVLTPHNAPMSPEAVVDGTERAVDHVLAYLAGNPINVVNGPIVVRA